MLYTNTNVVDISSLYGWQQSVSKEPTQYGSGQLWVLLKPNCHTRTSIVNLNFTCRTKMRRKKRRKLALRNFFVCCYRSSVNLWHRHAIFNLLPFITVLHAYFNAWGAFNILECQSNSLAQTLFNWPWMNVPETITVRGNVNFFLSPHVKVLIANPLSLYIFFYSGNPSNIIYMYVKWLNQNWTVLNM